MAIKIIFVITLIILLQNFCLGSKSPKVGENGEILIGEINGKTYYYEPTKRNWGNAEWFCMIIRGKLAYFSNTNEAEFIRDNSPYGHYWTSGVNNPEMSDFHWKNSADVEIPPLVFTFPNPDSLDALTFYSSSPTLGPYFQQQPQHFEFPALCVVV